jgi:hypothetical protein
VTEIFDSNEPFTIELNIVQCEREIGETVRMQMSYPKNNYRSGNWNSYVITSQDSGEAEGDDRR